MINWLNQNGFIARLCSGCSGGTITFRGIKNAQIITGSFKVKSESWYVKKKLTVRGQGVEKLKEILK